MLNHLFFLLSVSLLLTSGCSKSTIKPLQEIIQPSVLANSWYSHDATTLTAELNNYFSLAEKHFSSNHNNTSAVQALVVPHAAYYYSGLCAATAYQSLLKPQPSRFSFSNRKNSVIKRVIILAPCHTMFHQGIALPYYNTYETVLGKIPVDSQAIKQLSAHPPFAIFGEAHLHEHAIEMQLPFLQSAINDFKIVPLVLGHLTDEEIIATARALDTIIDDQTLIVVSSDFTHYGDTYDFQPFTKNIQLNVRRLDSLAIQSLSVPSLDAFQEILRSTKATICGKEPLQVLLALFETHKYSHVHAETTCYYTSAQIMGARNKLNETIKREALFAVQPDKNSAQSVSYAGMVYRKAQPPETNAFSFNDYEKKALLTTARASIENHFQENQLPEHLLYPVVTPAFENTPDIFVTLKMPDNHLRGCIGTIGTHNPLYKSVHDMGISAAFNDHRFLPLTPGELADASIEISLLTSPRPIKSPQEIVLGTHGIILEKHDREGTMLGSALFLPAVARECKWTLEETLAELSMKAGLLPSSWQDNTTFSVFETYEIKETHEHNEK